MASRVLSRISLMKSHLLLARVSSRPQLLRSFSGTHESASSSSKWLHSQTRQPRNSRLMGNVFQKFVFSTSASQATEKEINRPESQDNISGKTPDSSQETSEARVSESTEANGDSMPPKQSVDADIEPELSVEELVKLVAEKDELLNTKQKEIERMQDKVLRTYAEMENVLERTKREVENSKKFGVQNFARGLLDVADNLARASNAVKDNFSKIDQTNDGVGPTLLKSLLEGVEMTDKQLVEVFRKFGIEKYDPLNEKFDPNRHNAVYEIPDASKPPGTVATVLKLGYVLHERVIRPAEVGVIKSCNDDSNTGSVA